MGVEQCGSLENISNLGSSNNRSICHIREQEGGSALFLDSTSTSSNSRCISHKLGQYVCICISSSDSYPKSTAAHAEISMRDNTDSPILAQTTLVSSIAKIACSISISNSNNRKSVDSGKKKCSTSRSGHIQVDCMASINQRLKAKGFSENAQKLLSTSWRSSTQKGYKCKFRKFHCWCSEREIDPYTASLENCANFLTDLFETGLKYRTIAGYRSMLSLVLSPIEKFPVGQHPYIIRLLKGVFNSRPPVRKLLPEWDLPLVLDMLKTESFEPKIC